MQLARKLEIGDKFPDMGISSQQGIEVIVKYLQDFGLTENEAMIYLSLSKMSSATASEVASATQLSSLQTYRAIKGLLDNGLVEMSLERPRRFIPLKIEQVVSLLSQEAEQKLLDLENKTSLLLNAWTALGDIEIDRKRYTFRIVQGRKNVSKFRLMLYHSAKKNIAAIMKPNELARMVLEGVDDAFEALSLKNITVRGLSELNQYNIGASKRFFELINFHHVSHSNLIPLAIIDGEEALICVSSDNKGGASENAIWTNHPELVGVFKEVFETLWNGSQDAESRIKEVEQRTSNDSS